MEKFIDKKVIHESPRGRFEVATVELTNGKRVTREWYVRPAGAIIIGIDKQRRILLTKEWRSAAEKIQIDLPRGFLNKGETPEEGARREFKEETGFYAKKLTLLHHEGPTSNSIKAETYIFLAEELEPGIPEGGDEDYPIEVIPTPIEDAFRMAFDELVIEPPVVVKSLLWLRKWLRTQGRIKY